MNLGNNIKYYRNKQGLTQEKLAEKMGVSVGAVSKWESGANCPELPLLLRLAQTFQVSLDALTGFELNSQHREMCLARLKDLTRAKQYEDGLEEVKDILKSYPNDFQILFDSARFFQLKGIEEADKPSLEQAIFLYRKAIHFIEQNDNPHINQEVVENIIAKLLIEVGKYTEALEILKKNNSYNINDFAIAETMVHYLGQSAQALPLLSQEFYVLVSKFFQICFTFVQAYYQLGRLEEAEDILQRAWPLLDSFLQPDRISIFDKLLVIYKTHEAVILQELGQIDLSAKALREAQKAALRFDQDPNFNLQGLPHFYLEDNYFVYDDFGQNSIKAIGETLLALSADASYKLWEQIQEEKHAKNS